MSVQISVIFFGVLDTFVINYKLFSDDFFFSEHLKILSMDKVLKILIWVFDSPIKLIRWGLNWKI